MGKIIILLGFLINSFLCWSQKSTFGIVVSPRVTFGSSIVDGNTKKISYSTGVFFNQKVWKRLGINTGIQYLRLNNTSISPNCGFDICPSIFFDLEQKLSIIEVPLNTTIQLNSINNEKRKVLALFGFSFGKVLGGKDIYEYSTFDTSVDWTKSINVGIEIRHLINEKYSIEWGGIGNFMKTNVYWGRISESVGVFVRVGKVL